MMGVLLTVELASSNNTLYTFKIDIKPKRDEERKQRNRIDCPFNAFLNRHRRGDGQVPRARSNAESELSAGNEPRLLVGRPDGHVLRSEREGQHPRLSGGIHFLAESSKQPDRLIRLGFREGEVLQEEIKN